MGSFFKRFNWILFAAMMALITVGTVSIWSAGNARVESVFHGIWLKNLTTALFGLMLYFVISCTDYRKLLDTLSAPFYVGALALLVAVLVFGSTIYGGRRWLWFFQPSEISKLCVIAFAAALFGGEETRFARVRSSFRGFLVACGLVGVPSLLILAEPDLGTTLTLVPAVAVMMFVAGVWRKGLVALVTVGAILAMCVLGAVYEAERPGTSSERRAQILKYLPLRDHQVRRVRVFLFPDEDPTGSGYTLRQAKISIGSGGFSGKGIGKGETNRLKYLPQSISMNDFIFCVYAEETGFVGTMALLCLFAALILPCCWVAFVSGERRGQLLALGVATLIFAHVYINVGMSLGLVPITGLPLPFVSNGRTFLVTVMCGLGLVQSVSVHRTEDVVREEENVV